MWQEVFHKKRNKKTKDYLLSKNILITPLNWGLGHATRCVPIIRNIMEQGHNVIVAADKAPLAFLQKEFPELEFIKLPGFEPTYSKGNSQVFKLLTSIPGALIDFRREHLEIEKIVKQYKIDIIISDNRFGCWSKDVYSIFITHQLHIQVPRLFKWTYPIVNMMSRFYIRHYDELWIPDVEKEPSLSGVLSHPADARIKTKYIGILSRFGNHDADNDIEADYTYDYLVILSGPEPQRTILEDIIIKQASDVEGKIIVLRAKPDQENLPSNIPGNIIIYNHVEDNLFVELASKSKNIICRGGYSSLMDLVCLNRNAYLVPTPGQTEQEYLADYLTKKGLFNSCRQGDFQLKNVNIPNVNLKDFFMTKDRKQMHENHD